jgi:hypothetical protein
MQEIENTKRDILNTLCWIKKVIASVETKDQLESAKRMSDNWTRITYRRIESFKPIFFGSLLGWRSLSEAHAKARKEIESHLAVKNAKIRFIERDEM